MFNFKFKSTGRPATKREKLVKVVMAVGLTTVAIGSIVVASQSSNTRG